MTDGPDREGPLVPPENGTGEAASGQDGNARQNAAPPPQYASPPPQYAPPPQYVYPPQVQTPLSTLSILGFVFAFVMSLVGLILSIVAYSNAKGEGDLRSKNFSQIGIILSAVFFGAECGGRHYRRHSGLLRACRLLAILLKVKLKGSEKAALFQRARQIFLCVRLAECYFAGFCGSASALSCAGSVRFCHSGTGCRTETPFFCSARTVSARGMPSPYTQTDCVTSSDTKFAQ